MTLSITSIATSQVNLMRNQHELDKPTTDSISMMFQLVLGSTCFFISKKWSWLLQHLLRCESSLRPPYMTKTVTKRYYPTPALEKGLDILELFASTPEGMSVSEAARRLDRTVSEIFRMILCLEQRGYLAQSPNKERYHLTLRLFRLAQEHPPTKRLVMEALPAMHWLAHELRQSCHLGVIDGGHVVILAQVDSPAPTGFYVKVGSKVDLMHAATGHVILAHLPEEDRQRIVDEWRSESKRRKPSDLEEHLARILVHGYERRASYEIAGVVNVSFPILNVQGSAIAGLTVPYVKRMEDTVGIRDVINKLRIASRRLSEAMGAQMTDTLPSSH